MKKFNTPSKGAIYNTKDFEHLFNTTKDVAEALASVLTESAAPVRISGVEFTITNNNNDYECTEGWLLYQNTFYKVEAFQGSASGSQIPVFNFETTSLAHEPHDLYEGFNKVGTFFICQEEKLKPSFGASGTGLFDYTEIIKHPVQRNSDAIASLQGLISGMIVPYYNENWQANFDGKGKGINDLIGYAICDGRNGTPDLRGMMIVGASDSNPSSGNPYANDPDVDIVDHIWEITGLAKITLTVEQLPPHTHPLNDPGHSHIVNLSKNSASGSSGGSPVLGTADTSASTTTSTTGISISSTGSGDAITIRPPARVMLYLMKL